MKYIHVSRGKNKVYISNVHVKTQLLRYDMAEKENTGIFKKIFLTLLGCTLLFCFHMWGDSKWLTVIGPCHIQSRIWLVILNLLTYENPTLRISDMKSNFFLLSEIIYSLFKIPDYKTIMVKSPSRTG